MKRLLAVLFVAIAFLAPHTAEAHLVNTGLGPVYDGISHVAISPEYWVPILAMSLFAGLRGVNIARVTLLLLPVSWLAGGLSSQMVRIAPGIPFSAIAFLLTGLLVAANQPFAPGAVHFCAICLGMVQGWLNAVEMNFSAGQISGVFGSTLPVFILVALVTGLVVSLKKTWAIIAVRVAGSWIAATGLLLIGWSLRTKN